jgi:hypothetical protein
MHLPGDLHHAFAVFNLAGLRSGTQSAAPSSRAYENEKLQVARPRSQGNHSLFRDQTRYLGWQFGFVGYQKSAPNGLPPAQTPVSAQNGDRMRLITRNGYDWTKSYPWIV